MQTNVVKDTFSFIPKSSPAPYQTIQKRSIPPHWCGFTQWEEWLSYVHREFDKTEFPSRRKKHLFPWHFSTHRIHQLALCLQRHQDLNFRIVMGLKWYYAYILPSSLPFSSLSLYINMDYPICYFDCELLLRSILVPI